MRMLPFKVAVNSAGRRNRCDLGRPRRARGKIMRSDACGLWRGAQTICGTRPLTSCGRENHGCACVSARWVDMCVSSGLFLLWMVLAAMLAAKRAANLLPPINVCQHIIPLTVCKCRRHIVPVDNCFFTG